MKIVTILKYLFTFIGAGMLVGAFFLVTNTQEFLKTAVTTKGVVTKLVRTRSNDSYVFKPVVQFETVEGDITEFMSSVGSNPASYYQGENVEVLYQPSFESDAKINSFFSLWGGGIIVAVLGCSFFLIGFIMILVGLFKSNKVKYLKEHGIPIQAAIKGVDLITSYTVNDEHPYQIISHWKQTNSSDIHVFYSENIWFDPSEYIEEIDEVTVLIEKDNPSKYYVDVSFLPKLAS